MTRIVAVAYPKGGTAKSQTAAALAAVSAQRGKQTLLLDIDPQGSSGTVISGVVAVDEETSAGAFFQDKPRFPSEIAQASKYGFDVVAAKTESGTNGLVHADNWISRTTLGQQRLRGLLRRDEGLSRYDLVFLDTVGAQVGLLASALLAATDVLIPITPSVLSTNELPEFLQLCQDFSEVRVNDLGGSAINVLGVVLVRVKGNTNAARESFDDMSAAVDAGFVKRLETVIPEATVMEDAARAGAPVVCYRRSATVSKRYFDLFDELFGDAISEVA